MSVKRIKYSFITALLCLFFDLYAGEITVRRIPVAKQLSSSTVYRTFQDKDGFVWLGTTDGFCRYDGYEMKSFRSEVSSPTFPSNYITGGFAEDTLTRTIWAGTEKGVLVIDEHTHTITILDTALLEQSPIRQILYVGDAMWVCSDFGLYLYNLDKTLRKKYLSGANSIHIDNRGIIRVTVWRGGMYYLDRASDTFKPCPKIGGSNNPHKIFQDNAGGFWICTWGDGLYRFYPDSPTQDMYRRVSVSDDKKIDFGIFFDIEQDDANGYIWTLSYSGVIVFKPEDNRIVPVNELAEKINGQTNFFSDIMKDRDGNIWLGTYNQGAILVCPGRNAVVNCDLNFIKAETGYIPNIGNVFEDNEGELWVAQNRLGIYLLERENSEIRKLDIPEIKDIFSICNCSALNEIWVAAMYVKNIYRLRKMEGKVVLLGMTDMNVEGNTRAIKFLHEDKNGVVWATTDNTLFSWNRDGWHVVNSDCGNITGITEDSEGAIWLGTTENGLWRVIREQNETVMKNYNINTCSIAGNNISCIDADAKGYLWFCVNERQLYGYDIARQQFTDYTQKANVNNMVIFNIVADNNGHILISSSRQIVEFNPSTGASIRFDAQSDIIINSMNKNAVTKIRDGSIVFGGDGGACIFTSSPQLDMPCKKVKPTVTDVKINGKPVYKREINRRNSNRQKELILYPNETNLEISFSSFNYLNPGKTGYAYKLDEVDEQWIYTESNRNFAVYNQLRKGKYTFLVKSTGDNQLWSNEITRLVIIKKPAFYETGWAYAVYVAITVLILFAVLRFYLSRVKLRNELHIAQIDKEKSEELIQAKLRFFTNIGHEFRTPLTLIMTPLSTLINHLTDESLKQKLKTIYRSAEDMLGLINQLLDFRKLEMGGEKLKLSCNDFVKFAEYVHLAFKDVAENKSIHFTFESDIRQMFMAFDKSKVRKIINNLYSNALKFTSEEGYIATAVRFVQEGEREFVRIDITDNGCGIPEKEQQTIFERFYQSESNDPDKTGSGIGLHLVKEYVELHGGRISVRSKVGEGSVFSVFIPADLQFANNIIETDTNVSDSPVPSETKIDDSRERKTLLIAEDNRELRCFLAEQLGDKFAVLQAADGKQGLTIAMKKLPDLIISDLMMPVMDGVEMCQRLKTDIQTSHIPVILLTAKLSDETKIESYKAGADSYIAKPFNFEVLLTRIEMLIEQQEKRKKLFHKTIEIMPSAITTTSLDEELMKKALLAVEKNIDNSGYSVDDLSTELALSRRQLSRKFQSIIDLSPGEFIRSIRLKRAAQLLKDSKYNISEIADMVGFSTIKYFNINFKDEFGVTPSQYRDKIMN
ncbi:MAG: response regulator [Tannerella sp.]|jgi:signal transduction histidine kinase/DNA-binding response OmpR family regulator/ligand-binding sensor domain-containing protein|nr:response regulator [Tannerella sp.]